MDLSSDQQQFLIRNLQSTATFMRNMELLLTPLDILKIARIDDVISRINNLPPDVTVQHLFEMLDFMQALTRSVRYND